MVEPVLMENIDKIVGGVANSLLSNEEAKSIVDRTKLSPPRALNLFKSWYQSIFRGKYDREHVLSMFKIGLAHAKVGVPERLMIMNMGAFIRETMEILSASNATGEIYVSVAKSLIWNLTIMVQSYYEARMAALNEAPGLSKKILERLIKTSAAQIYNSFKEKIE